MAASVFNVVLAPDPLGGLPNILSAPLVKNPGPYPVVVGLNRWVSLFESISLAGSNGDGSLDDGVDGASVGSGDVHFRLQFLATSAAVPRSLTLEFGVLDEYGQAAIGDGGVILPFSNTTLDLTVVPEPGTVILMGLGLMGLAARRR